MIKMRLKGGMAIFVAILTSLSFGAVTAFAKNSLDNSVYFSGSSFLRSTTDEKLVLQKVNEERAKFRAANLTWDSRLASVARSYSRQMAQENFFSHKDRSGKGLVERMKEFDLTNWSGIGENLYYCQGMDDPMSAAVAGWLKSSGHRSNLLNSSWKSSGIGIATSVEGKVYVTQIFMR